MTRHIARTVVTKDAFWKLAVREERSQSASRMETPVGAAQGLR